MLSLSERFVITELISRLTKLILNPLFDFFIMWKEKDKIYPLIIN